MRMIAGFIAPSAGQVSVCGHDIERAPVAAKSCMGYLPEGAPSYGEMTVAEFLDFVADVRGLTGERRRLRRDVVIDRLGLAPVIRQVVETLSKGFRRRVGLAQALIHDPQVLILDEPTDGLDPNQKHEVRRLINELSKDKLVIVSTHILEEVHEVCTRAIIIANGRIVADETPTALEARSRYHHAVSLRFDKPARTRRGTPRNRPAPGGRRSRIRCPRAAAHGSAEARRQHPVRGERDHREEQLGRARTASRSGAAR